MERWKYPISDSSHRNLSLVVAQYAAPLFSSFQPHRMANSITNNISVYDRLLQQTSLVNQAYCRAWKCDYWILRGIPFQNGSDTTSSSGETATAIITERHIVEGHRQREVVPPDFSPILSVTTNKTFDQAHADETAIPASRSTYNKIVILELALQEGRHDRLLLLDADAMVYDFDRDIAAAVPDNRVFTAHRTHGNVTNTGSVNVGVTVWNLRHPLTPMIVQRWKQSCLARIRDNKHDDDQAPLQHFLKELPDAQRDRVVYAIPDELGYAKGAWIKHFIRRSDDWRAGRLRGDERQAQITAAARTVCRRYYPVCEEEEDDNDDKDNNESEAKHDGVAKKQDDRYDLQLT